MGKSQSKILYSISYGFSKRGDAKKDPAELSLMRVRSTSLESVSTVHTGQLNDKLSQSRSCSLDDIRNVNSILANQNTPSKFHDDRSFLIDRNASLDSPSLSVGCGGDSPKARGFTQSLPTEIERKINIGSKVTELKREADCFSDNFTEPQVSQTTTQERVGIDEDAWRSSPRERSCFEEKALPPPELRECSFQLPSIPDCLLQKLSPEEWSLFINFVCTTLESSLQSSIIDEKLKHSLFKAKSSENTTNHTSREDKMSKDQKRTRDERSHQKQNGQDLFDTSYPECGDRPLSFPSLHGITDDPDLIERLQALSLERQEVEPEIGLAVELERRSRSKSQDDCYYQLTRDRGHRHHHKCTHRSNRKRRNTPRERSGHVDVSLDDNCPGLPQNRVTRRSRHHTYQQRTAGAAVCDQCLQDRLKCSTNHSPPPTKRQRSHRLIHGATGEVVVRDEQDSSSPGSKSVGEGETEIHQNSFMTLEDIKSVTCDFLKGTNDLDESVIEDLKMQFLLGMEEQRKHNASATVAAALLTKQSGHRSLTRRMNAIHQPCLSRNRPPRHKPSPCLAPSANKRSSAPLWSQLAFPTEPHTGQDSPRTDMAVINLDLDGSSMRRRLHPTSLKDLSSAGGDEKYVHHVIHHSQP